VRLSCAGRRRPERRPRSTHDGAATRTSALRSRTARGVARSTSRRAADVAPRSGATVLRAGARFLGAMHRPTRRALRPRGAMHRPSGPSSEPFGPSSEPFGPSSEPFGPSPALPGPSSALPGPLFGLPDHRSVPRTRSPSPRAAHTVAARWTSARPHRAPPAAHLIRGLGTDAAPRGPKHRPADRTMRPSLRRTVLPRRDPRRGASMSISKKSCNARPQFLPV
jgi:hypothetical protein